MNAGAALLILLALLFSAAGCKEPETGLVQGYVEGEYVYVASPLAGRLQSLAVRRGAQVKAGDPLFALEESPESAAQNEAASRLAQARANLEDARKGKRTSELTALSAQLRQAQAASELAEKTLDRADQLLRAKASSAEDSDRARSARDQARQKVAGLEAELETARLGSRVDQVAAAESEVRAREAALAKSEWEVAQKRQAAPRAALVFDTLFREGEWVPAGRPVVSLLPPAGIKVRAFIPEPRLGALRVGGRARVTVDGAGGPYSATVSFISPKAEFTPPVIYSRESRAKLVFMVELTFAPEISERLHPGQPVDVRFEE